VDWDLEGNDDRHAPTSHFTIETLNVMADFAACAKEELGLVVSMAPAESYLDALGPQGAVAVRLGCTSGVEVGRHSEGHVELTQCGAADAPCRLYGLL
jgi:hypothetical protein